MVTDAMEGAVVGPDEVAARLTETTPTRRNRVLKKEAARTAKSGLP
jgi:hypothetical protein